ncbi:hypothetical protein [Candidatus Entotheonella palauensis]|uniref:hypothetical protein n=1 Tax=Candidatus Entotheonella palauensis TaxID=93172 RepID=UPI0004B018A2|nr:hypothetical protein [Candidatus Entotheonella palauensis]
MAISQEQGIPFYEAPAMIQHGWTLIVQDRMAEGFAQLHEGLARHDAMGSTLTWSVRFVILAEAYQRHDQPEEGLRVLADRFSQSDDRGEMTFEAELYRLQGALLLQQSGAHAPAAEIAFQHALDIARDQGAKSWELRAATGLARLWQSQGKHREALDLLAPVYGRFTEGFDTVDLREAKQVLDELR